MSLELQQSLKRLIQQDFEIDSLEQLLSPVPFYTNNPIFVSNFIEIARIVTQDRDADHKFTANDLLLFSKDIIAMTAFITAILLIVNSIPNIKITYTEGETEELIFKFIVYIFFVIIPKHTGLQLTQLEKEAILNVSILVYLSFIQTQLLKKLIVKVLGWFKKQWIHCCNNETALDKNMPALHIKLDNAIKQQI